MNLDTRPQRGIYTWFELKEVKNLEQVGCFIVNTSHLQNEAFSVLKHHGILFLFLPLLPLFIFVHTVSPPFLPFHIKINLSCI